jgi:hypothetical protein
MPADHGSRCNQNERLFPPEPHLPQHNPEQLMQGGQSTTRTFGVQSQQLLTESEIFQNEVLPELKVLTTHPKKCRSEVTTTEIVARILSKSAASSSPASHSFRECTKF